MLGDRDVYYDDSFATVLMLSFSEDHKGSVWKSWEGGDDM